MDIGASQSPDLDSSLILQTKTKLGIRDNIEFLQNMGFLPVPEKADPVLEIVPELSRCRRV
jgi:hypothetical protein